MVNPHRTVDNLDGQACGGAISIGNFDGVHRGHAVLAARLRLMADALRGPAVAVTFDPAPVVILRPAGVPPQLTTIARRTELLQRCGVDHVVVCRTNQELLNQTAERFFAALVVKELAAKGMVEGPNFYFGRGRQGDQALLRKLCDEQRMELEIVEPQHDESQADGAAIISSTRVRELLSAGQVDDANRLLTAAYQLSGQVVRGAARGREIGFPTANLDEVATLVPGAGVYACRVHFDAGHSLKAATHIGPNPTFDEAAAKVEVHLLDFSGDLYGKVLTVDFISRVRDVERFDSTADLTKQLKQDVQVIRQLLR